MPTTRRELLRAGLVGTAALATARIAPASGVDRPVITHGVQSGLPALSSALVWARADRPSRMLVHVGDRTIPGPVVLEDTDLTGRVRLEGLPAGQEVAYRVDFEDTDTGVRSEPVTGTLRTAPLQRGDVRLVWGGDVGGQGWGIDPAFGGMRTFATMAAAEPHLFVSAGDNVYADVPLPAERVLRDGRVWHNVRTPSKTRAATTLEEFRGQYAYNRLDDHVRAFTAQVPQIVSADDHEVFDNWYPGTTGHLGARGRRAFTEWLPTTGTPYRRVRWGPHLDVFQLDMRSRRDPNGPNSAAGPGPGLLGTAQLDWLLAQLRASRATWRVLVAPTPLGLLARDGDSAWDGLAQGDPGAPLGREHELARLLQTAAREGYGRRLVVLTGDVHYAAAHRYSPARASIGGFTSFWEFVAGPLHAGAYGAKALDPTFGPAVMFRRAATQDGTGPAEGFQSFGQVRIAGDTGVMTVSLHDGWDGRVLYAVDLPPAA